MDIYISRLAERGEGGIIVAGMDIYNLVSFAGIFVLLGVAGSVFAQRPTAPGL